MSKVEVICKNCGKKVLKWPSHAKRGKNTFCSYLCKKTWQKGKHIGGNTEVCPICKKIYYIKQSAMVRTGNPRKTCSKECRSILLSYKTGKKHPKYKNGKWNRSDGYIDATIPQKRGKAKRILEHRKIMQEMIGRELKSNEVVHHINRIKNDNR
ncbi:MAG: HNH endonuclease, partial [Proteobacteria bacterium]|nr:HNH endonuclease [Pseudomonadota bacterium]